MAVATIQTSEGESQFRVEATGAFREPRTRILKHGDTFAVLNHFGDIAGDRGSPDGLYHHDTRHLSQLELYLNGDRPLLLSANPGEDNALAALRRAPIGRGGGAALLGARRRRARHASAVRAAACAP